MEQAKNHVLLVEDDTSLGAVVRDSIALQGYQVSLCVDGISAWKIYQQNNPDICILDVMLPILDGFDLAKKIREKDLNTPIIFLTAKSLKEDKIKGLKLGGDDYLVKPFNIEELLLKIDIFLRRSKPFPQIKKNKIYHLGQYVFDVEELMLKYNSSEQKLTPREVEILELFCQNLNQILRREYILEKIWGENDYFMGRSLDVFMVKLRKYLKKDENIKIENIPSIGFKLKIK